MHLKRKKGGTKIRKIAFRTGKILGYNPWNMDAEPGDKMIDPKGNVYRLEERGGDPELYPRKINPPNKRAIKINGVWYWIIFSSSNVPVNTEASTQSE